MGWSRRGTLVAFGAAAIVSAIPITASAERVVYINLEPTTLISDAGHDPTMNSYATTGFMPGPISGWPALTEAQKAELLYWLREASAPFDITYTFDRPAAGSYDMLATGTDVDNEALFPGVGCAAAIGLADCGDTNGENISFLFHGCMSAMEQADMRRVAFNALAALGFGWGLENLTGSGQVMAGYTVFSLEFGDECTTISGTSTCEHMGCPAGQQNSTTDLTAVIGARVDDGPPVVTILSPDNLEVVQGDVSFVVEAEITDKFGGLSAALEIVEGMFVQPLEDPSDLTRPERFAWTVTLPAGAMSWTLRVSGTDADGNVTTEEVVVCVDMASCDAGPSSDGSDSGGSSSSESGDEPITTGPIFPETTGTSDDNDSATGGPIDPSIPAETTFDIGPAGTGCHCRSTPTPSGAGWSLLALLGLVGRLRRKRVRAR